MRERTLRRKEAARQRKKSRQTEGAAAGAFTEDRTPVSVVVLVLLPLVVVPLYFLVIPASVSDMPLTGIIINESQKYVAELTVVGIVLGIGGFYMVRRNSWPVVPGHLLWPLAACLAALAASLFQAVNPALGLVEGLEVYLLPLLFFAFASAWTLSRNQLLAIVFAALAAGAIVAAIGICQAYDIGGAKTLLPHLGPGSLLFNKNLAGEYLITLIPLSAAIALMPVKAVWRLLAAALGVVLMVHLVLTGARGAWVGLVFGDSLALLLGGAGLYFAARQARQQGFDSSRGGLRPLRISGLFAPVPLFLALIVASPWWVAEDVRHMKALGAVRILVEALLAKISPGLLLAVCVVLLALGCAGALVYAVRRISSSQAQNRGKLFPSRATHILAGLILLVLILVSSATWWGTKSSDADSPESRFARMISNPSSRFEIWGDALELLSDTWLAGVGPGHYVVHAPKVWGKSGRKKILWDDKNGTLRYSHSSHNDYLQIWQELGVLGLLAILCVFAAVSWAAAKGIGRAIVKKDLARALIIKGALAGFLAFAVSMMFEFPFRMPASLLMGWFCAAVAVSFSRAEKTRWAPLPGRGNIAMGVVLIVLTAGSLTVAHKIFWADVYDNKANWAWDLQRMQEAYEWGDKAYRYVPWEHDPALNQARTAFALKRFSRALEISRDLVEKYPYSLPGIWMRGISAYNSGQREEARRAFKRLVTEFPNLNEVDKYRKLAGMPEKQQGKSSAP